MQILFEPKYNIGDVVALKINSEDEMVIDGFNLRQVSEAGEVIHFVYYMYNGEGTTFNYSDIDLELIKLRTNNE